MQLCARDGAGARDVACVGGYFGLYEHDMKTHIDILRSVPDYTAPKALRATPSQEYWQTPRFII